MGDSAFLVPFFRGGGLDVPLKQEQVELTCVMHSSPAARKSEFDEYLRGFTKPHVILTPSGPRFTAPEHFSFLGAGRLVGKPDPRHTARLSG